MVCLDTCKRKVLISPKSTGLWCCFLFLWEFVCIEEHIDASFIDFNAFVLEERSLYVSFLSEFECTYMPRFTNDSSPTTRWPLMSRHAREQKSYDFGGYVLLELIAEYAPNNTVWWHISIWNLVDERNHSNFERRVGHAVIIRANTTLVLYYFGDFTYWDIWARWLWVVLGHRMFAYLLGYLAIGNVWIWAQVRLLLREVQHVLFVMIEEVIYGECPGMNTCLLSLRVRTIADRWGEV